MLWFNIQPTFIFMPKSMVSKKKTDHSGSMWLKDHALTNHIAANTGSYHVRIVNSHCSTAKVEQFIHSWKHNGGAQQQPIIFDGKAIRIGGHSIVASKLGERALDGNSMTDSSQVHCLLWDAIKCNHEWLQELLSRNSLDLDAWWTSSALLWHQPHQWYFTGLAFWLWMLYCKPY